MNVIDMEIAGVKIVEPDIRRDERGCFCETYNRRRYFDAGITAGFVQDNESFSMKGVVRGLHWQAAPFGQAKLVRVIRGRIFDVAVDLRKGSPTFGRHIATEISAEDGRQLFIPRGFAHGFMVLEDNTVFSYKCDNFYNVEFERGLQFDDPLLGIKWPDVGIDFIVSDKDRSHPSLAEVEQYDESGRV
jgi:dTDP-4-dehydrorhamnose 3,5-epimerase